MARTTLVKQGAFDADLEAAINANFTDSVSQSLTTAQSIAGPLTLSSTIVGGKPPLIAAAATLAPTAAQSGSLILMGATSGEVITLPTPVVGVYFDIVIMVTNTTNYNEIQTAASTFLLGAVTHSATGIAALTFWADGTATRAIKMDGAHLGGLIGSRFHIEAISTTVWEITGVNLGTATMTTAFTATP